MPEPKRAGFLQYDRDPGSHEPAGERVRHAHEFELPRDPQVRRQQGARCMGCGVPFCHQGCPLGNLIPDFNGALAEDRLRHAWDALDRTNNLPEITGRVCPAPCEAACTLAINDQPVTIERNERDITEIAFEQGWVTPRPAPRSTGRTVAVVGSGPAGIAAAQQLCRGGHQVHLYERADRLGGLLRYGIPDFKLEKRVIDRRLAQLEAEGVRFHTGVDVGNTVRWDALRDEHDALVVTIGATRARELDVPGRDLAGVHLAMDFLERNNRTVAGDTVDDPIRADGREVIVLGGGDTGSDCLGTSLRHGARSVLQLELMPAAPTARTVHNPWPRWPVVLRTSSSQEEGGERAWGWMTTRLSGEDGRLTALHAVPVDASLQPVGDERTWPCDLLLLAMGFLGPATHTLVEQLGLALGPRGTLATDGYRSSDPKVYAAGDARRGASLVVWAISEGREAARAVDAMLAGRVRLPTRGRDLAPEP